MSNQSKALASAIGELRNAANQMKNANNQSSPKAKSKASKKKAARKRRLQSARQGDSTFSAAQPGSLIGRQTGVSSAYSTPTRTGVPRQIRGDRSVRIVHRELVASVAGSVGFTATKYAVNPGLAATFPWLAIQAAQWEEYRFHKLSFEFISRAGSSSAGTVQIGPDYDASDATPTTEQIVSTFQDVVEDNCWKNICCDLNAASMHGAMPRKWLRSSVVAGTDIKTYDVANVFVCTADESGTTIVGKLWVCYDVEFFIPQTSPAASPVAQQTSVYTQHAATSFTTATPKAIAFDSTAVDALNIGSAVAGVFTPPAGAYRVFAQASLNDSASESFAATLQLYKNGAALSPVLEAQFNKPGATQAAFSLSLEGYVTCSGTDTVQIEATLTGAGGTLTALADSAQVVFVAA